MPTVELADGVGLGCVGNVELMDNYIRKVRLYDQLALHTFALRLCAEESCQTINRLIAQHAQKARDGELDPVLHAQAVRARATFVHDLDALNRALDVFACAVEEIMHESKLQVHSRKVSHARFRDAFDALSRPIELRAMAMPSELLHEIVRHSARLADRYRAGETPPAELTRPSGRFSVTAIVQSWRTLSALSQALDVGPHSSADSQDTSTEATPSAFGLLGRLLGRDAARPRAANVLRG